MKFVLVYATIVMLANGNMDHNKTDVNVIRTPYNSESQCNYYGEKYVRQQLEKQQYKNLGYTNPYFSCVPINK
jgi:hypothetical protein